MAEKKIGTKMKKKSPEQVPLDTNVLFPLKGYLILNIIFWGYCLLQIIVLRWLLRDVVGLIFFFVVLGVGFTLVSIYDYIYDHITYKKRNILKSNLEERQ